MLSSFASRSSLFASAFLIVAVAACTTNVVQTSSSGNAKPDGGSTAGNGPPIDASQLGGACSGFGTGIGQTAAFQSEDCAAGVCLVDAREGLSLYCSADCTNATCPDGWECQAVDNGSPEHACFRIGDGSGNGDGGAGDGAVATTGFDVPLLGYREGANSSTAFSIADLKDPTQADTELIVLVVASGWSTYDHALMEELEPATFTKTKIVGVFAEGAKPGTGATKTEFDSWHKKYPAHAKVLDPELASLKTEIGAIAPGEIEAFPTLIGLDAATLKEVGREAGYQNADDLKVMFDGWRAKTK